MKKVAYVLGTIGVIILLLTTLFKFHHWAGAGILLIYGTIFNCIIVLPIIAIYLFKGKSHNKNLYLYGTLSAFIMFAGIFFKIQHWAGSTLVHAVGTDLFIVFVILFALNLYKFQKG